MSPRLPVAQSKNSVLALVPLGAAGFFLLAGYELVRPVSKSLFIEAYGAKNVPWVMGGSPLFLFLLIFLYGKMLTVLKPWKTFLATKAVIFAAFITFWAMLNSGFRPAAALFYMFREAYIMLIVEQCWSFVNSRVSASSAKKVYGFFLAATGSGSILGSWIVSRWVHSLSSQTMILLAALALIPSAALSYVAFQWGGEPRVEKAPRGDALALRLVAGSRLLMLMAGLVFVTQAVGALLEYRMDLLAGLAYPEGQADLRTAFYGTFQLWVNIVSTLAQLAGTPFILSFLSPRAALIGIPAVQVLSLGALIGAPSLATASWALGAFKTFDYSLHRAAKEMLYIPLGFNERYRAKPLLDGVGYRGSKAVLGLGLGTLAKALGQAVNPQGYALAALAGLGAWLGLVLGLPKGSGRKA